MLFFSRHAFKQNINNFCYCIMNKQSSVQIYKRLVFSLFNQFENMAMINCLCQVCETNHGIFRCNGCLQGFCVDHVLEHHDEMIKDLDRTQEFHNEIKQILESKFNRMEEQENELLYKELVKTIDEWEKKSVNQIQQLANEAREQLAMYTTERLTQMKKKLNVINDELEQRRQRRDFHETDLHSWFDKLQRLKTELIEPSKILIEKDYEKIIPKLSIRFHETDESFQQSSSSVKFENNGKVVCLENQLNSYTEVRGGCEYSFGEHPIRFLIEETNGWILFGIISKSTPLQTHSYVSPSCYGWYNGQSFVYAAGANIGGTGHDIIQGDQVCLIINCDEKSIKLINERSNKQLKLQVDTEKCPFPWQLHLNLELPNTRIRIIS